MCDMSVSCVAWLLPMSHMRTQVTNCTRTPPSVTLFSPHLTPPPLVVWSTDTATHCNALQHTTTHCSTTHYHTLQHTTTHCNAPLALLWCDCHHTATHCNALHHNALQHTATHRWNSFVAIAWRGDSVAHTTHPHTCMCYVILMNESRHTNKCTMSHSRASRCGTTHHTHIKTHFRTLTHTLSLVGVRPCPPSPHWNMPNEYTMHSDWTIPMCNTLQHTARHYCKTLQDTAIHYCITLQDTTRHWKTLQDTSTTQPQRCVDSLNSHLSFVKEACFGQGSVPKESL